MSDIPGSVITPGEEQPVSPAAVSWYQPAAGHSIRTRLLALLLGLITLSVLTVGYLAVNSVQNVGARAREVSTEALRSQTEEYLRQMTVADAHASDLTLKRVQQDAANVAQYAATIFEQPDAFSGSDYWRASERMFFGPDGQYLNGESDVSSVFVPHFVDVDQELHQLLELGAHLDFILAPMYEGDPNTVAVYMGTEQNVVWYHPNVSLGTLVPPDFSVTQRPWYLSAAPESNPGRAVVWSPVYVDATGQGLLVTAAAPVYVGGDEFIGAVGIDATLKDISASVEEARLLGSGYSFLIDDTGHAIVLPEQGYRDILARSPAPDEVRTDLSAVETEFAPVLAEMMTGATGFAILEVGERELFVAYAPLESAGWGLANVVDAETVLQAVGSLQGELETATRSFVLARILPLGGGILVVMVGIGLLLTNRLVNPLRSLAMAAQRVGAGEWDVSLPPAGGDEIGVLSQAFAAMIVQLRELMEGLEERVAERTRLLQEANYALQRRAIQLEASSEVGQAIASIFDVDQLLRTTVELIRDRFKFYHAGIFLLDDVGEWAILREATGEAGAQMKIQGHRLAVDNTSMVGWAALHRQPRIALDVGEDAVHFANPLLPYTRSEMSSPLMIGGRVIGVLNVQSTEEAAFDADDIRTLQGMADQVAVAIENARRASDEAAVLEATSPIYRASRHLTTATTTNEVADAIIDSVAETSADGCLVVEFEFSPGGEPRALIYRGVWRRDREPQFQAGLRLPIAESPFPFELVSKLWVAPDVEQDERLPQSARQVFLATDARALVNIPLRSGEDVIGQVVVLRTTPGPFSDSALRLYEVLS
ncbi:MAG: GAF domain-containing protein, partial [Chloroflexota bacterium]|nr:GAF domain-containing protein [Chloroflexota bacterium]